MEETKKKTGMIRRIPERVELGRRYEIEGAQGTLVHGGQDHAEDGQGQGHFHNEVPGFPESEPFKGGRHPFDKQGDEIEEDAQAHFEEHRGGAGLDKDGVREPPGPADVVVQGKDDQGIAQEGGEDGGPDRGMIAFEAEDIAGGGGGVAAGGQSDAAEQIEADPDAPGVVIRQVGDPGQALGEAQDGDEWRRSAG